MKKIFITGSTTGLGFLAGKLLLELGHEVVFHARNEKKAEEAKKELGREVPFVIGDVSEIFGMKHVAEEANTHGPFDAVIHNVGVYERNTEHMTKDGLRTMFAVNVLAPYVISEMLDRPERMIFMSSGMHTNGKADLIDPQWEARPWNTTKAYCDSKLFDLMLVKWYARHWKRSYINAVNPGWVPTRMGGPGAPDDLLKGAETQAWLAVSNDPEALVSGKYFYHKKENHYNPEADDEEAQEKLVAYLRSLSGV